MGRQIEAKLSTVVEKEKNIYKCNKNIIDAITEVKDTLTEKDLDKLCPEKI